MIKTQDIIRGSIAGLVATAPMTWTMRAAERLVPWHAKHGRAKLPPRQITEKALEAVGVKHELGESERTAATVAAHYAFGTAAGGLLGLAAAGPKILPSPVRGAIVGLGVWAASYMGWLPAVGIRRNAKDEPAERNFQMIAAHIVWGCVAGVVLDRIEKLERS